MRLAELPVQICDMHVLDRVAQDLLNVLSHGSRDVVKGLI
jgi:hypothetical protein